MLVPFLVSGCYVGFMHILSVMCEQALVFLHLQDNLLYLAKFFRMRYIILLSLIIGFSVTGFAQKKGKPKSGYDKIYPFKNGMAKVEKDGKQGFINTGGEEFVPCKYDAIYPWEKDRAKVEIAGKFGFINIQGEEYIPVKYDFIGAYKNGLAIVSLGGRRGLINEAGEEIVPLE